MLSCVDAATEARMKEEVEEVSRTGDTVGGVFEVVVHGVPAGLGTYANWDERLDGLLAWSVMSLQAVKAVEIGRGVTAAESFGSKVHDPIHYASEANGQPTRFTRPAEQCGRNRGRRFERRGHCGARLSEADLDAAPAAGVGAL
jgi:chorismate synthase